MQAGPSPRHRRARSRPAQVRLYDKTALRAFLKQNHSNVVSHTTVSTANPGVGRGLFLLRGKYGLPGYAGTDAQRLAGKRRAAVPEKALWPIFLVS